MAAPHDLPLTGLAPVKKKPIPPTTDKPVVKKPPPAKAPLGLNGQANAIVNSELNPVINQARTSNAQQTQAIASFTKMLLAAVQGIPNSIGKGYDGAIGTQTNIANAAADALRNANPNQQDQNILNAVGAPQSQHDQIASHLADTFGGGAAVGQYNNLLRTNDLQANKLASVNFAKTLPAIEGLRGNQSLQNALYTQQKGMSDLLSQRPKLVQDALNSLYDQQAKQDQLNIERQSLGLKAQNQTFTQTLATDKYNLDVAKTKTTIAKWNAQQKNAETKIDPSVSKGISDGFAHNAQGAIINGPDGKPIKFVKTTTKSGSKVASVPQINSFLKSLPQISSTRTPDSSGGSTTSKSVSGYAMTYKAAYKRLRTMGLDDQTARTDLNSVYPRGQGGRSWLTNSEQAILRKAGSSYIGTKPYGTVSATVKKYQGLGYLDLAQARVLTKSYQLPPGYWGTINNGRTKVYYIKPTN